MKSDTYDKYDKNYDKNKNNNMNSNENSPEKNSPEKINIQNSTDTNTSINLPSHVFLCSNFFFYIPVDRALRVLSAIFESAGISSDLQKIYFTQLELQAHILNKAGEYVRTFLCVFF